HTRSDRDWSSDVCSSDLLKRATLEAKIDMTQIDAFAATSGPGLASSLMIGASIAKGLAIGFNKPYLAINHLEGHLLSPFFVESRSEERRVGKELRCGWLR